LLAVGQLSPTLTLYRIENKTGALAELGKYPVGKGANWIEMVDFDDNNAQ
jgi:6-phosphogluconolactonase